MTTNKTLILAAAALVVGATPALAWKDSRNNQNGMYAFVREHNAKMERRFEVPASLEIRAATTVQPKKAVKQQPKAQ
ncbi:hypothetical protein [Flaviflagellibacter deserti]|uniref:Uncharacterized protein n=1 Tax=Flaviflagellibacter deserti TaxID=2267266 RepID=A0ABV9Z383_9HYPH